MCEILDLSVVADADRMYFFNFTRTLLESHTLNTQVPVQFERACVPM